MKGILIGVAILPFIGGLASAADRLNDAQLDHVVAGETPNIYCPTCIVATSSSVSINGITTTVNMTTMPPTGGSGGGSDNTGDTGGSGNTGGTGGSGDTGGGGSGDTGSTGGNTGTVIGGGGNGSSNEGPIVVSPPASFVANLVHSAGFNPVLP